MSNRLTSVQLLELIASCISEFFEAEKTDDEADRNYDIYFDDESDLPF